MPPDPPGHAGRPGASWPAVALLVLLGLLAGAATVVAIVVQARPPAPPEVTAEVGPSEDGYAVWARNRDGRPVRWDPCTRIDVVLSTSGTPRSYPHADLVTDLRAAIATLRAASGLDLRLAGTTSEVPDAARSTVSRDGRAWAPVLVGWRPAGEGGLPLRDHDRAVAVPVAVGPSGERVYVTGQVVLNPARDDLQPGRADRATSWGATLLHELAHALGLAHVDDPDQLMNTYPGTGPVELGTGDRAGLTAVGAGGPCLPAPEPRELDVAIPPR